VLGVALRAPVVVVREVAGVEDPADELLNHWLYPVVRYPQRHISPKGMCVMG
jgi:hypothetical protein